MRLPFCLSRPRQPSVFGACSYCGAGGASYDLHEQPNQNLGAASGLLGLPSQYGVTCLRAMEGAIRSCSGGGMCTVMHALWNAACCVLTPLTKALRTPCAKSCGGSCRCRVRPTIHGAGKFGNGLFLGGGEECSAGPRPGGSGPQGPPGSWPRGCPRGPLRGRGCPAASGTT